MIDFYEHIDDYVEGKLDQSTLDLMNHAIAKDHNLKEAITNYPTAKKISEALLEIDILEKIKSLEDTNLNETGTRSAQINYKKGIAFLIVFIAILSLLLGYNYLSNQKTANQNELFASLYTPPIDRQAVRSIMIEDKDAFSKGKHYFSLNDYSKALVHFNEAEKELSNANTTVDYTKSELFYWIGHVYINNKEWALAKKYFEKSQEKGSQENIALIERIQEF